MRNNKLSVVIGRFSPLHWGHATLLEKAIEDPNSDLLVLIGSSNVAPSIKNPWGFPDRARMLTRWWNSQMRGHDLYYAPLADSAYDPSWWVQNASQIIEKVADGREVTLYGHKRDSSSYYLYNLKYKFEDVGTLFHDVSATTCREYFFEKLCPYKLQVLIPPSTWEIINPAKQYDTNNLFEEYEQVKAFRASWGDKPYKPTFVTTDATAFSWTNEEKWRVLLIQRKSFPGKGLWAVPGGFIEQGETLLDGVIRELIEETSLHLWQGCDDKEVLKRNVQGSYVFDDPYRDVRGRFITHNFLWTLNSTPMVKANDDAKNVEWKPMSWCLENPEKFAGDHFKMLMVMAKKAQVMESTLHQPVNVIKF